jgi:hypothetical protein
VSGRDVPLADRLGATLCRLTHAMEQSAALVAESRRLRDLHRGGISAPPEYVVWTNAEAETVCTITAYSPSIHAVRVAIHGATVSSQTFIDPVEAAEETERLRRIYVEPW